MRHIKRQAIVGLPNHLVFDVVNDIARYPQWFSWCADAQVLERTTDSSGSEQIIARLDVKLAGIQLSFATQNTVSRPLHIKLELKSGALRSLRGEWNFEPLGPMGTRVNLKLDLDFSSSLLGAAAAIAVERWANSIMDDFLRVAKAQGKAMLAAS
jgi:ribosome-associated toxin RatA of RatAB toxin-antitoxin module